MFNFKGFDDWVQIFKGGKQKDSQGRIHDGDELIEKAIKSFNPPEYEPPIVIGHPRGEAPVLGRVQALKKIGNTLCAKFKNIVPGLEDLVKRGLFKKRSASFYQNGELRHVGFLGAMPPAVKGLADINFQERGEIMFIEFNEKTDDPGEFLHQRILELLENPPEFSDEGRKIEGGMTYSKAFSVVQKRYPAVTKKYMETLKI